MRVVVGLLLLLSLALSGSFARYSFWPTLAQGEPVYRHLDAVRPLEVSRAEAAWIAFSTPDPHEPEMAFYLFRFLAPVAALFTLAALREIRRGAPLQRT